MNKRLTVALLARNFNWGGGIDFLHNLACGINRVERQDREYVIYFLIPLRSQAVGSRPSMTVLSKHLAKRCIELIKYGLKHAIPVVLAEDYKIFDSLETSSIKIIYYDPDKEGLIRVLKDISADVVLPANGTLGRNFPVPWIGYLYDFQHKYFPQNFDRTECLNRDIDFATMLRDAPAVIVNSEDVKNDARQFFPYADHNKVINLPFAPRPLQDWFHAPKVDVVNRYQLPSSYFIVCNQFWLHKDHLTAFKAISMLCDEQDISLICTGTMEDYRRPAYIEELKTFISENGLTFRILLLGHIPKSDQIEVMKRSIAIVQPTLFEGGPGGGAVYDAVSLGIPVILSDIDINFEVDSGIRYYFMAGDPVDLAKTMKLVMSDKTIRASEIDLVSIGDINLRRLGLRLSEAIDLVI